ncbi:Oderant binding protein 5, partial [Operophtera brumata]
FKNGKVNYEAAMKQADMLLPDEIKEPAKEAITACRKDADAHKDICDSAFFMTKCIYNHNPSVFYF